MRKTWTVFLDRDGVINRRKGYTKSWDEFEFIDGAKEAIAEISKVARIIILTNQRGIAKGVMTEQDLDEIHKRMLLEIERAGGRIDAIYYCPHDEGCPCRKPNTGLIEKSVKDFGIDLKRSLVVGDTDADIKMARKIGIVCLKVGNDKTLKADYEFSSLKEAKELILKLVRK